MISLQECRAADAADPLARLVISFAPRSPGTIYLDANSLGATSSRPSSTSPTLLLLDEPSLGLSPANQHQIIATMQDLRARGLTVLAVEQNAEA